MSITGELPADQMERRRAVEALGAEAFRLMEIALRRVPEVVVRPSAPILYFGDLSGFQQSSRRIVTVGLNPSLAEFPATDPWSRFPAASSEADEAYFSGLDRYFAEAPYRSWFTAFEPLLQGLGASYYPNQACTALHTDLCSPVATNPTWSKLTDGQRGALRVEGLGLWRELMSALRPHLIIISVAAHHLGRVGLPPLTEWSTVHTVERANPYLFRATRMQLSNSEATVVFGQAAEKPFGVVSNADKTAAGQVLAGLLDA